MKEKFSELIAKTDVSQFIVIEPTWLDLERIESDIKEKTAEKKPASKRRMYIYALAAAIMLLIVSVSVIALLTKNAVVYDNPEYSVVSGTVTEKTALDNIRLKGFTVMSHSQAGAKRNWRTALHAFRTAVRFMRTTAISIILVFTDGSLKSIP